MDPFTIGITSGITIALPVILSAIQLITAVLPAIAAAILNWVITTPVSFTHEQIVLTGWEITRGFVNIFFVLALVVIGLATALRLESYGMKKALPMFVIVALLVNFTPVICGLIIDGSNIVMNTFKERVLNVPTLFIKSNALQNLAQTEIQGVDFWDKLKILFTEGGIVSFYLTTVSKALAGILFNLALFLILLVYALVFILRIVVIWILIILSPIAFAGLIFPATKNLWESWWKQFIQWSIIGIPLFFFLYLAEVALKTPICTGGEGAFKVGAWDWLSGPVLCSMVSFLIPLFFLVIGLFVGMQAGDIGAKYLITGARKGGTKAIQWAWGRTKPWLQERVPESVRKVATKMATAPTPGEEIPGWRGKLTRGIATPIWATGRAMGGAVRGVMRGEKATVQESEKKWKGALYEDKVSGFLQATSEAERIGIMNALIEDNQHRKFMTEKFVTNEMKLRMIKKAMELNEEKKLIPALLPETDQENWLQRAGIKLTPEDKAEGYDTLVKKVVGKAKPSDIKYFSLGALSTPEAKEALHRFWTGAQIAEAVKELGRPFLETFQSQANRNGLEWYEKNNPRLARYLSSSAAHALGLEAPPRLVIPTKPYVPPSPKPAPPTEEELAKEEILKDDLRAMRSRYRQLFRMPSGTRRPEEEEEMKMLKHAIEDLKKRLRK